MSEQHLEIIRERERFRMTGLSRTQWWRLERAGRVPRRIQLGENSVGWIRSELEAWVLSRRAGRPTGADPRAEVVVSMAGKGRPSRRVMRST
jgi:predicted DNA-binding transcriptional regulator AlpA